MSTLSSGTIASLCDLEEVLAVLKLVFLAPGLARELARLAGRNEPRAELVGDRGAHHEAAGLGADDLGDAAPRKVVGDIVHHALEALRIADERRDVAEEHAWLRIIGDLGNQAIVIEGTHRTILSRTCFRMCFHKHP